MSHHAFLVDDIVQEIFNAVVGPNNGEPTQADRRTLACLARTCKTLNPYAIERLWSSLPSMVPLLSLLAPLRPTVTIEERVRLNPTSEEFSLPENSGGYSWVLDEASTLQNESRLQLYAPFVRKIRVSETPQLDPSVFTHLEHADISKPLLPALKVLECQKSQWSTLAVPWLIGPCLRSFSTIPASHPYDPQTQESGCAQTLLNELYTASPDIETLVIAEILPSELNAIIPFSSLRSLDLSNIKSCDTGFLRSLAELPHLHTLRLPNRVVGIPSPVPGGFAQLVHLALLHRDVDLDTAIETIAPSRLQVFSLSGYFEWASISRTVLSRCCTNTLTEVRMAQIPSTSLNLNILEATDILKLFLPARNLHTLVLVACFQLADADLLLFPQHWPSLRVLELGCMGDERKPTIQGIAALSEACPSLDTIGVGQVQWPVAPDPEMVPPLRPSNVRILDLGSLNFFPGADPSAIAPVVDRLFPALDLHSSRAHIVYIDTVFSNKGPSAFWKASLDEVEKIRNSRRDANGGDIVGHV